MPPEHEYFVLHPPGDMTIHWDRVPLETGVSPEEFERFTDAIGRPTFVPPLTIGGGEEPSITEDARRQAPGPGRGTGDPGETDHPRIIR